MACLLVHSVFIVGYFVTARYRLPMLPVLGIYGVYAGVSLYDRIRDGAGVSATRLAVGLIAVGLVANLPIVHVSRHHSYIDHFDLAVMLMDQDRLPDALEQLERSAEIEPTAPIVAIARCRLTLQIRGATEAVEVCRRAVQLDPFAADAHYQLGTALEQLQRSAEAVGHFKVASELEPTAGEFRRALERARRSSQRKSRVDGR
jgi:tetratricopeptide (TPR) repeat protein